VGRQVTEQQLNQQSLGSGVVFDMMSPVGAGKHTGYNVAMHRHDHSIVTARHSGRNISGPLSAIRTF
jgi:hypothetical protein